jgi:alpha-amylase
MSKKGIVFYFHVHQPFRVRHYSIFDISNKHDYFDQARYDYHSKCNNEMIFKKVADKSYRPMNALLEKLVKEHPDFKFSFSITGTFIEQAEMWAPDILESFKRLVKSGKAEIVSETYYHSLAFFYDREEFSRQVAMHRAKIKEVFGVDTKVFRNTELAYNNELAKWADDNGFEGILAEGWDPILEWRSPNFVYRPVGTSNIKLLLKNYKMSDDLAFRFGDKSWKEWPMTADKFDLWANESLKDQEILNLFVDYETFGEHQWSDTGIFEFFDFFVKKWLSRNDTTFYTTSDAIHSFESSGEISMPYTVTWADTERDLTAWLGNSMQQEAIKCLYEIENDVLRTEDTELISDWRKLQTSDHVYYMCTKWFNDGDVHAYFSPYDSPYDAFIYFMNAIRDIKWRANQINYNKVVK